MQSLKKTRVLLETQTERCSELGPGSILYMCAYISNYNNQIKIGFTFRVGGMGGAGGKKEKGVIHFN